ncbi:MAG TPA: hypothetical protein VK764_10690 [Terracidiphilus sp.]|nr:hypothetical protein [Terracidiphilus sp.]
MEGFDEDSEEVEVEAGFEGADFAAGSELAAFESPAGEAPVSFVLLSGVLLSEELEELFDA